MPGLQAGWPNIPAAARAPDDHEGQVCITTGSLGRPVQWLATVATLKLHPSRSLDRFQDRSSCTRALELEEAICLGNEQETVPQTASLLTARRR